MAKKVKKRKTGNQAQARAPRPSAKRPKREGLGFTRKNYGLFGLGLLCIVFGYVTLGLGSITLAPILLVGGYCVLVPMAILIR
jgi:hypothetical protein